MNYINRYKSEKRLKTIKQVIKALFYGFAFVGFCAMFYVLLVSVMLLTN